MEDRDLRELLEAIPDSYEDFVEGVLDVIASDRELETAILDFISRENNITTSDLIPTKYESTMRRCTVLF